MTEDTAKFQNLLSQGHSAAWDQDWEKAISFYKNALEEMPDHPTALASLGLSYFQLKKYDEALSYYSRISTIQPDDPMPFEKSARIYERIGKINEAVQSFMQGGELQLKARDVDHSIDDFINAIRLNPENQAAHTRLAMIYDKLGRKEEAVTEYLATASLMQANGASAKALQVVQYSLQVMPNNEAATRALAALKNNQMLPKVEPVKGSTGPFRMAQVRSMEAAGLNKETEEPSHYDPITETRLKALKEMASLLFEQNDQAMGNRQNSRAGLSALTRGTGRLSLENAERTRIQLHLSQAIDLQTSGQDEQAAAELGSAIDLGLNQSASFFVLGLLLRKRDSKKSLGFLQRSIKNPDYALSSNLLMAEINEKNGQFKEASMNYLEALRLADCETVPEEQSDELFQLYEPIVESFSAVTEDQDIRSICSAIASQLMRPDWREYLLAARRQLPPQPEGSPPIPLAEMFLESNSSTIVEAMISIKNLAAEGKLRAAMEEAYHALVFAPYYLPLHIQMGEILISEGRIIEAVEKFLLIADDFNIRGQTSQAINLLKRVSKLAPMDLSVRKTLINLLQVSGRQDDAIKEMMDLANVYYLLAELDPARQTYQDALSLSQQSSSTRQWSIDILNKLADIELQSLNWKQAIRALEQLRSIQPQEPGPRVSLIDLEMQMGQEDSALIELESYLKVLENAGQSDKCASFLDEVLKEHSTSMKLQNRMANFYTGKNQTSIAVEKLDALAEKLLKAEDKEGALATIKNILALNPPNASDYQKLYNELSLK